VYSPFAQALHDQGWQLMQLPGPELAVAGPAPSDAAAQRAGF
jgi:hypothetical protein